MTLADQPPVVTAPRSVPPDPPAREVSLVDADVHPSPASPAELKRYLSAEWRTQHDNTLSVLPLNLYLPRGGGNRADASAPDGSPACSDPTFTEQQLFDDASVDMAILIPLFRPQPNKRYEAAIAEATNRWVAATWLEEWNGHNRYRGSINVVVDQPAHAVAEIRRWSSHPAFVQVRVNAYNEAPLGDERYHPIYEAAAEHGLPVAVHPSKGGGMSLLQPVGFVPSFAEFHSIGYPLAYAGHLVSLLCSGIFERLPDLRFVFVEGGFAWVQPLLWRLDTQWTQRGEEIADRVHRLPSDTVVDQVRFTTQPLEEPEGREDLPVVLERSRAAEILMFSTDYPHWDFDNPKQGNVQRIPKALRPQIFSRTAIDLYRLPRTLV